MRYPGVEEEVPAQGNRVLSPDKSTQYSLFAASPVGQSEAAVTVEVNPVISAPTADLAAANDAVPAADAETATWTPTSVPADTPTPVFTQTPIPTETSTETSTETPLPPQPATDTPVVEQRQALVAQADSPLDSDDCGDAGRRCHGTGAYSAGGRDSGAGGSWRCAAAMTARPTRSQVRGGRLW